MSAGDLALLIIGSIIAVAAGVTILITVMWDIKQWRSRRAKVKESPPPPTLHEVYAADMDHWDKRYQDALLAGLGDECCVCDHNGGRYSCLIHRKPSSHPPAIYIQREAAAYRERRARENHR